jgi:hypothetical protein
MGLFFCYIIQDSRQSQATKWEVADTRKGVVLVFQVIHTEQVYIQYRRKEEIKWQTKKSELD